MANRRCWGNSNVSECLFFHRQTRKIVPIVDVRRREADALSVLDIQVSLPGFVSSLFSNEIRSEYLDTGVRLIIPATVDLNCLEGRAHSIGPKPLEECLSKVSTK